MSKVRLVLADSDEAYVGKLYDYIIRNYSTRFQVSLYTEKQCLYKSLENAEKNIDILLISPELYSDSINTNHVKTLILLSAGIGSVNGDNIESVNKYQHVEKLINSVITTYSEKNGEEALIQTGKRKTKLVGFYSPSGGVGKTTIAAAASMLSSELGNTVFYLNLEDINSTQAIFKGDSDQTMSNMFYYLKEKNKSLHIKIEGARCVDEVSKVHFFLPQESIRESEDIIPEEMSELIKSLVKIGQYDYLFIDFTTSLNKRNLSILEACDSIVLLASDDEISSTKVTLFLHELTILNIRENVSLSDKIILLINKAINNYPDGFKALVLKGEYSYRYVPYVQGLKTSNLSVILKEKSNSFTQGIYQLLNII